jgi:hypothetical protein
MVATVTGSVSPGMDGLASAFELGNAYQMVGSVGYDIDDFQGTDASSIDVGFTYYWKPVNNDDKPIGLQEFLQKATKISANAWLISVDGGDDETAWQVAGNYGFMENKLIAEAAVNSKYAIGDIVFAGKDWFGFEVGAKYYIMDTLTAGASFASNTNDDADQTITDINVKAEYAVELGGRWLDANLLVDLGSNDDADMSWTMIKIGATYYVMKELGITAAYGMSSGDEEGDGLEVGATYYFKPLAVGAMYRSYSPEGEEDITSISIKVEYRF